MLRVGGCRRRHAGQGTWALGCSCCFTRLRPLFEQAVAVACVWWVCRETLMGKYGEDSKLIYDLADQV